MMSLLLGTPTIYELDEHGEANGRVYFFCSVRCRDHFAEDNLNGVAHFKATDGEPIEGTVCDEDECGAAVPLPLV